MAKAIKRNSATHIESPKIEAKLRMFANANQEVNEIRAEFTGNMAVTQSYKTSDKQVRQDNPTKMPRRTKAGTKKKLSRPPANILANVFVELSPDSSGELDGEITRKNNLVSVRLPLTELKKLSDRKDVIGIENSRMLKFAEPLVDNPYVKKPPVSKYRSLEKNYRPKHPVLIGIIDVGGFDFAHPDFLDENGETRFLKIWDQGGTTRPSPEPFNYGAEFDRTHLNKAIRNAKKVGVPATSIEKQSQTTIGSHATHVTSIAAGNSGVFPHADIVAVSIAMKKSDLEDKRKSFYDSTCLIHAMDYLLSYASQGDNRGKKKKAKKYKARPISINVSLGTNGHAHDGTDVASRWIDAELAIPGRSVCIAAGNSGQEKPLFENDLGFVTGRIHTSGRIEAKGLSKDVFWNVVGNSVTDFSENELEIWYAPQDRLAVRVKPPGMNWIGPIEPNEYIENKQLANGTFVSIYNDLYHFANGSNYIAVYISPNMNKQNPIPVSAGEWQVRLTGLDIRDGSFDGWIERDDPRPLGLNNSREQWNFPSFFSEATNVDNTSISSLACARNVIAVGNCDDVKEQINITSSQGPTRDKRSKPEVIAPGTNIVAAKGFSSPGDDWISMTGTSMASPFVCGIAAWMLSLDSNLTAAQIQGIIIRTSSPLPGQGYAWKNDTGFGFIAPEQCLEEALLMRTKKDKTDSRKKSLTKKKK